MRLITQKIYRAFPVLDHLSDEACRRVIRKARGRWWLWRLWMWLVAVIVFYISASVFSILCLLFLNAMSLLDGGGFGQRLGWVILLVMQLLLPALCALLVRDRMLGVRVKKGLRGRLQHLRCGKCDYLLIGVSSASGSVTCPECGETYTLEQLGIEEKDLLAPSTGDAATG